MPDPIGRTVRRDRAALPKLGTALPQGPLVLDTNVFINALAGRGPTALRRHLEAVPRLFVAAPKRAELPWVQGRLDPDHPGTGRVLTTYEALLQRIDPAKVLVPDDPDWLAAGELAGRVARVLAGGGGKVATAFDRVELIRSCPVAWCRIGYLIALSGWVGRIYQAATAGSLMMGSLHNPAMVSSVM